uniref:Phorbol-ester/DAG-type domain-containing protein n=1 Tax=Electrophorus electricus TaxID=8005 RepID=A0A4W4H7T2_ELEEL
AALAARLIILALSSTQQHSVFPELWGEMTEFQPPTPRSYPRAGPCRGCGRHREVIKQECTNCHELHIGGCAL